MTENELLDLYFQNALKQLTGKRPPANFKFKPVDEREHDLQQDWAVSNGRRPWVCGISILEAARAFVADARENGNIMREEAPYTEKFEQSARRK